MGSTSSLMLEIVNFWKLKIAKNCENAKFYWYWDSITDEFSALIKSRLKSLKITVIKRKHTKNK